MSSDRPLGIEPCTLNSLAPTLWKTVVAEKLPQASPSPLDSVETPLESPTGAVLESPTSNQDMVLTTAVSQVTATAPLLVEETEAKVVKILSEAWLKTKN